jgi:hypothetical protein
MENQHLVLWCGPCSTQRQARELISGPNLATRARLLSFIRTQSRVVIGLLTGHDTLSWYLCVMGLSNNPTCRKCGAEEETFCVSVRPWLHSDIHTWVPSFWTLRIWYDTIRYIFTCNWVATRWQLFSTHVHTNNTGNVTKQTIYRTTQKYIERYKKYIEQHNN